MQIKLLPAFLLLYLSAFSQTVVTVVDGSLSDHDHVFEEWYDYSHVQYIYDKALIGQSGTITDIQFEHTNNSCTTNNIRIYIGSSSKTSFTGSSDWINSGLALVYSGSVTPVNGWYNLDITDFFYDNSYNLVIAIDNDDGSYCGTSSYMHYYNASPGYSMLRDRGSSDVGAYGTISSVGTRQMELASLKLVFLNLTPCSGTPTGGTTFATVVSGCATYSSTLTVNGSGSEAGLTYQWQQSADGLTWSNIVSATNMSYIASVTGTSFYRRITTCSNSGLSAGSDSILLIADCYQMTDGDTIITCSGYFYDSGGLSGNYSNNENKVMTFCSGNINEHIRFVFSNFYTSKNNDILDVFDGPSTSSQLIFSLSGQATGSDVPPDIISTDSCVTFRFTSDASSNYSGWIASISCTPDANNVPRDYCGGAAHICNLNGYTGKTSSFYNKDFPGNMCDIDEGTQPCNIFSGNIHNNSWISFTPVSASATFDVSVTNCSQDQGIQMGIYAGTNCDNFVLLSNIALTEGQVGVPTALPNNTTTTVTVPYGGAPALVPGQTYYIMVDGQSGDVCDYSITATSGVEGASIDITDTSICFGNSITLTASGGSNYSWSTNPVSTNSSVIVSPVSTTTYSVTITGGNPLCPDMAIVSSDITVNPIPVATATPSIQSICSVDASSNIILGADISGTTLSWTRNNPAGVTTTLPLSGSGITIGGIIAGGNFTNTTASPVDIIYTITPVSPTSCTGASITATVTVNPMPAVGIISYNNPAVCAGTDGSIAVTDDISYSYLWNTSPQQTTATASNLSSGNYIVTVSAGICSVTLNQSLVDPGAPIITLSGSDTIICSGQNVSFTAGGVTAGTYQFFVNGISQQGPGANNTFSSTTLTNNDIVNVVGVQAGCTGTGSSIVMSVNSLPSVTITEQTQEICSGLSSSDMILTTNVAGTNFDWIRTNPIGISSNLALSATGVQNGESIPGDVFINSTTNPLTVTFTITPTGPLPTYCAGNSETATITVYPLPSIDTIMVTNVNVCAAPWDGSIVVNAEFGTPPYTYSFNGNAFSSGNIYQAVNVGTYIFVVRDSKGCLADSSASVISVAGSVIDSLGITHVSCYGSATGQIVVHAADAVLFSINGGTQQTDSTFQNLPVGNYTLQIWDAGNCLASDTATIIQPTPLSVTTSSHNAACGLNNGYVAVQITGSNPPYTYSWNSCPACNNDTLSSVISGLYTVTIQDSLLCSDTADIFLAEDLPGSITLLFENVSCYGFSDGYITAGMINGALPVNFQWSDGNNGNTIDSLATGQYYITATEANGCVSDTNINITQPGPISIIFYSDSVTCFGNNNGKAIAWASGGDSPYTYIWNAPGVQTDSVAVNLQAGSYTVTVSDSKSCTVSDTIQIYQPNLIVAESVVAPSSCSENADGKISIVVEGGYPPYSYSWNTNPLQNTPNAVNLKKGIYDVTITDKSGCVSIKTIELESGNIGCLEIPNAFTPNGDNVNDTWEIKYIELFPDVKVEIYNRWGNMIFASEGYQKPWDGTYNGNDAPTGSYIYIIVLNKTTAPVQGTLTLIR